MSLRRCRLGVVAVFLLLCVPQPARAEGTGKDSASARALEPVTQASSARAWADGVSLERQNAARELFQKGNVSLKDSAFAEATASYREALAEWDHPGIHYNLALALINLDRPPLEVREHLGEALKFGAAPLDQDKYEHAKSYLKLLEQNLVYVEISCAVPDASVSLGDQFLFRGPGRFEGFTEPGERMLRAIKPGFANTEIKKTLLPGKRVKVELKLYTPEELTEHQRRWPEWVPYVVTASGAAIGISGAVLLVQSNLKLKGFDNQASHDPACADGCPPELGLSQLHDTGNTYRDLATVGLAAGGAIFALGGALMILNLPVEVRLTPEERERRDGKPGSFAIAPLVGPRGAALVGKASF